MPGIRGMDCVLLVNMSTNADPYANPDWQPWSCCKDVKLDLTWNSADASCRGGGRFVQNLLTSGELKITGSAVKEKDDPVFVAVAAAALNTTILDLIVLDGPKSNATSEGFRFSGQVSSWSENQAYQDAVMMDFEIGVARSSHAPATVKGPIA